MTKGWRAFIFILASAASSALFATPTLADKRVALVLGNAHYAHINPLRNPINDAPDLATTLEKLGFEVILRMDARKGDFDRALAEFSRKSATADVALFYYAGHGVQHQGKNYLLPTDLEVQDVADVKFQAVDVANVRAALDESGGVKILVLDACRDNPFARQQVATRSMAGGAMTRGLARIDRTEGTLIAYATAPDQVAMDGGGRNSPFAEALIKRLKEPGLEIATMFRRVTADVYERTNRQQRPEVSSSLLNDFYLSPTESDRTVWERIRDSQDQAEFQKYIQRFPTSPFSREAQFRLDLFERIRRENDERVKREARLAEEKAEAERKQLEQIAAEKREAERAAAEKAETLRKEAERLAAEKTEKARIAAEKAEAERKDAERITAERRAVDERNKVAALEEQERKIREAEFDRKRVETECERERAELKSISASRQPDALEALRKRAACPSLGGAIDEEIKRMRKALARACAADRKALSGLKLGDLAALRGAVGQMSCDATRQEAEKRIADLEKAEQQAREACLADRRSVEAVDPTSFEAQQLYSALRAKLTCQDARHSLDSLFNQAETRTREAQTQLARLGCYAGPFDGRLGDATKASMAAYAGKKGLDAAAARLTDDFVSELKNQHLGVCTQAAPVANAPAVAPEKAQVQGTPHHEDEEKAKPARRRVRHAREEDEAPLRPVRRFPHHASRDEDSAFHSRNKVEKAGRAARIRPAPAAPSSPVAEAPSSQRLSVHGVGF